MVRVLNGWLRHHHRPRAAALLADVAAAAAAAAAAATARYCRRRSVAEPSTFVVGTVCLACTRIGSGLDLIEAGTRSDISRRCKKTLGATSMIHNM